MIVFIDTETGGTDPQRHSLLSIGAVVYEDGELKETLHTTIRHDTYKVTRSALAHNGIDLVQHDQSSPTHREAISQFTGWLKAVQKRAKTGKLIMGGHNPSFDRSFIKPQSGVLCQRPCKSVYGLGHLWCVELGL